MLTQVEAGVRVLTQVEAAGFAMTTFSTERVECAAAVALIAGMILLELLLFMY